MFHHFLLNIHFHYVMVKDEMHVCYCIIVCSNLMSISSTFFSFSLFPNAIAIHKVNFFLSSYHTIHLHSVCMCIIHIFFFFFFTFIRTLTLHSVFSRCCKESSYFVAKWYCVLWVVVVTIKLLFHSARTHIL